MLQLHPIQSTEDIFPEYRCTPIGLLLEYHNLNKSHNSYPSARLLIGMCMDNRKSLKIPENFAYIMRTGGSSLKGKEFNISYTIGVGNIKYMTIIGHDRCGMSNLKAHRNDYISGMTHNAGWTKELAAEYFDQEAPNFEIGNEIEFTLKEVNCLRKLYPAIVIVPFFFFLNDKSLCQIIEK